MPSSSPHYYYWDSCVFLAHIKREPGRFDTLAAILQTVKASKDSVIYTASLSIVEVAFGVDRELNDPGRPRNISPEKQLAINSMWTLPFMQTVDAPAPVMHEARNLIRRAAALGWTLTIPDAVHLASAKHVHTQINPIPALHTYKIKRFKRYEELIDLPIEEPYVAQPALGL